MGTFLVRFSSSKTGSFALAYVSSVNKVTHVIIRTTDTGFAVTEHSGERVYKSLPEIIQCYSHVLTIPFDSKLPKEP